MQGFFLFLFVQQKPKRNSAQVKKNKILSNKQTNNLCDESLVINIPEDVLKKQCYTIKDLAFGTITVKNALLKASRKVVSNKILFKP